MKARRYDRDADKEFSVTHPFRSVALISLLALAAVPKVEPTLGDRVVAFCKANLGKQVGDGQCANLAVEALASAGAKHRLPDDPNDGDYVWGDLVVVITGSPKGATFAEGKAVDIKAGDVVQYRDAALSGKRGRGTYTASADHHTSVVRSTARNGLTLNVYEQNVGGKLTVMESTTNLSDLRAGWMRVYRPTERGDGPRSAE